MQNMLSVILLPTLVFILQLVVDKIGKDTSRRVLEDSPPKEVVPQPYKIETLFSESDLFKFRYVYFTCNHSNLTIEIIVYKTSGQTNWTNCS